MRARTDVLRQCEVGAGRRPRRSATLMLNAGGHSPIPSGTAVRNTVMPSFPQHLSRQCPGPTCHAALHDTWSTGPCNSPRPSLPATSFRGLESGSGWDHRQDASPHIAVRGRDPPGCRRLVVSRHLGRALTCRWESRDEVLAALKSEEGPGPVLARRTRICGGSPRDGPRPGGGLRVYGAASARWRHQYLKRHHFYFVVSVNLAGQLHEQVKAFLRALRSAVTQSATEADNLGPRCCSVRFPCIRPGETDCRVLVPHRFNHAARVFSDVVLHRRG